MRIRLEKLLVRKLSATFVTTIFLSFVFVFIYLSSEFAFSHDQGNQFMGWFIVYALYIGMIILIYGNIVAVAIAYLQRKWFPHHNWLYVLILGILGLANGIWFQNGLFALYGMAAAIIYGIFDTWLYQREMEKKSFKPFWIIPTAFLVVCWSALEVTAPPQPPFLAENAVDVATAGEGSTVADFPGNIGKWEGIVEGYQVTRETEAEEIGDDTYLVTFTENWEKDGVHGTWIHSYEVDRRSMTVVNIDGEMPPYKNTA